MLSSESATFLLMTCVAVSRDAAMFQEHAARNGLEIQRLS